MPFWLVTATRTITAGTRDGLANVFRTIFIIVWDTGLEFLNCITPRKREIKSIWGEYIPPAETDSRSCCPALNALSNHGIFPRDGRGITFKQLGAEVNRHYNFAPSFCYFVGHFLADILRRDYSTDSLDLSDISVHNGIEHDGSITRYDAALHPDQSKPAPKLIDDFLATSKDGKTITAADISRVLTKRFAESKRTNGQFSLAFIHWFFAGNNAATLILQFGGQVEDIRPFLLEERIPDGWCNKFRARYGLTMPRFNWATFRVMLGVDPSWKEAGRKIEI